MSGSVAAQHCLSCCVDVCVSRTKGDAPRVMCVRIVLVQMLVGPLPFVHKGWDRLRQQSVFSASAAIMVWLGWEEKTAGWFAHWRLAMSLWFWAVDALCFCT